MRDMRDMRDVLNLSTYFFSHVDIAVLEKKLEKYKIVKQEMMQNLLTGKIRLIQYR